MKYKHLSSVFYKSKDEYNSLYASRYQSESAIHFNITIKDNPAFVLLTPEILRLIERIYQLNNELSYLDLPGIALGQYTNECLINEIILTNGIEGIRSTRKEVKDALDLTNTKERRFKDLAQKYLLLLNENDFPLSNSKDIRALFEQIVSSEIEEEKLLPDGEIFRKDMTSVVSATDTEKHKGVYPEKTIIKMLDESLRILNSDDMPYLIKIAFFHYIFGYIHPFYDGNGRMSRFISSYFLNKNLNKLVSIKISHSIESNKDKYYKAFDICNDEKNKGDVTPFILTFLKFIENAICDTINDMKQMRRKLDFYVEVLKNIEIDDYLANIIFVMIQKSLFDDSGFSIQELATVLEKSDYVVNGVLKKIQNIGFVINKTKEGRKFVYSIDLTQFEK